MKILLQTHWLNRGLPQANRTSEVIGRRALLEAPLTVYRC